MASLPDDPILRRLALYRLERGWSFEELSDEMTAAGCPVRVQALHRALTVRAKPRDTTYFMIEKFVAQVNRPSKRRAHATA